MSITKTVLRDGFAILTASMSHMDDPDEVLDLVDKSDQVVGTIVREDIVKLMQGTMPGFVRAAAIFVLNAKGQVWVPMRQPHKKIAPGGLDFSTAEHVRAGETYVHAAARGVKEELSLDVPESQLVYIGKTGALKGLPYFHAVFIVYAEFVPDFNRDDFVSYTWMLQARLQSGTPAKEFLLPAAELLISYLKQEQGHGQ
jgi:isopentenyldiphosphate isomerase